jgi:hypothetical protein
MIDPGFAAIERAPDAELLALDAEIRRLWRLSDDIEAERVDPVDDRWHELLSSDWEAARTFGVASGRTAAVDEIEALRLRADPLFARMEALPAQTPAGKAAKVRSLLVHVLGDEWRGPADDLHAEKAQARALLGELSGMSADDLAAV